MGILRCKEFYNRLNKLHHLSEVRNVIKDEHAYLSKEYNTIASLKKAFTDYRNWFKENEITHPSIDLPYFQSCLFSAFRLSDEQQEQFKSAKSRQVIDDMAALRPLDNVDAYLQKAIAILQGNSYLDQIIALCALTGRRTAEIATSAEFTYSSAHKILFSGQLKVKQREGVFPYVIPVFHDANVLIQALAGLRKSKPAFINNYKKFHDCCSKELNLRVKKHFKPFFHGDIKPKDLRSIYAEVCFKMFNEDKLLARPLYYARVLGHAELDVVTAQSYDDFRITDKNIMSV